MLICLLATEFIKWHNTDQWNTLFHLLHVRWCLKACEPCGCIWSVSVILGVNGLRSVAAENQRVWIPECMRSVFQERQKKNTIKKKRLIPLFSAQNKLPSWRNTNARQYNELCTVCPAGIGEDIWLRRKEAWLYEHWDWYETIKQLFDVKHFTTFHQFHWHHKLTVIQLLIYVGNLKWG